jgi:hypothetical protein
MNPASLPDMSGVSPSLAIMELFTLLTDLSAAEVTTQLLRAPAGPEPTKTPWRSIEPIAAYLKP